MGNEINLINLLFVLNKKKIFAVGNLRKIFTEYFGAEPVKKDQKSGQADYIIPYTPMNI